MKPEHLIQIICGNRRLAREYANELHKAAQPLLLRPIVLFAEVQLSEAGVSVFLLDQSGLDGKSKHSLKYAVDTLVKVAPVVVVAAPGRQSELTSLLTSGAADFVARTGDFEPLAIGLVERRMRLVKASRPPDYSGAVSGNWDADFGEVLRHEVNNPLTGILGNAEMLLARRDRLPASAIERVETIAHLAVRLRETVRRLSSAAELRHAG